MPTTPRHPTRAQRGAAALSVTLLLCFATALLVAHTNRNLVFEQRSAANQYRAAQAFEAAEAGLEWAAARLNDGQRVGADCAPSTDLAANSFRARHLDLARATGVFAPRTWARSGIATALRPSCVRSATGWSCSCPATTAPTLPPPAGAQAAPAFALEFIATGRPGIVRVVSTGCANLAGACQPGSSGRADASAKVDALLGLVGALRSAPAATVTTRGGFDAGSAAIGLHNADPATGIAVNAGGAINASNARLTTPAGASKADALLGGDAALAALDADRFFSAHFGLSKSAWARRPGVVRIDCTLACSAAVITAAAASADAALIHVDGDLRLTGPLTLGSLAHPALIVVAGTARIEGAVALNGVLHARELGWFDSHDGAFVRGALLSETGYSGNGTPALVYDRAVLDTLRLGAGGFARVPGSWRDF